MIRLGLWVGALVGLCAACGAASTQSSGVTGPNDDGGTTGDDSGGGGTDGGSGKGDGAAGDGATRNDASAPEPCSPLGAVRACMTAASSSGVQTCVEQPDKSLVWGQCVATACDATAKPGPLEVCVPAGQFNMGGLDGSNGTAEGDTLPGHQVALRHRVYFDKFEVSYDEFMAWWQPTPMIVANGALVYVSGTGDVLRWQGSANVKAPGTDSGFGCTAGYVGADPTKKAASINCVTQETALAYCLAKGKRLPTEAEWEWVASGQGANNPFPWGGTAPDATCSQAVDIDCKSAHSTQFPFVRGQTSAGDTASGVENLAGNEAEWTLDFAPPSACASTSQCWPAGQADPLAAQDNSNGHVIRGGYYASDADHVRAKSRGMTAGLMPTNAPAAAGFRCVRDEY